MSFETMNAVTAGIANVNVNEETFSVKVSYGDEIRRATVTGAAFVALRDLCAKLFELDPATVVLKYQDEDGDKITVSTDGEVNEAIRSAKDRVLRLFVDVKAPAAEVVPVTEDFPVPDAFPYGGRVGPMRGGFRGGFMHGPRKFHHRGPFPHSHPPFHHRGGPFGPGGPGPVPPFPPGPHDAPQGSGPIPPFPHDGPEGPVPPFPPGPFGHRGPHGHHGPHGHRGRGPRGGPYAHAFKEYKHALKEQIRMMKENAVTDEDRQAIKELKEQIKAAKKEMKGCKTGWKNDWKADWKAEKAQWKEYKKCEKKDKKDRKCEKGDRFIAKHVADVTIPDNSELPADTPVTKTWRLRNAGVLAWPADSQLIFISRRGDNLNGPERVFVGAVDPLQEVDVSVTFITPPEPGRYIGYYRMATGDGSKFGQRVWVSFIIPNAARAAAATTTTATTAPDAAEDIDDFTMQ